MSQQKWKNTGHVKNVAFAAPVPKWTGFLEHCHVSNRRHTIAAEQYAEAWFGEQIHLVHERVAFMTLTVADTEEKYVIKRISGKPKVKQHLKKQGFVVGTVVSVMNASAAMSSSRDATHKTYH